MDLSKVYKNCPPIINEITEGNQLVVYTIVREGLGMSVGKIAGQCQHAIQYLMEKFIIDRDVIKFNKENIIDAFRFVNRMNLWKESKTHTKIVLKASDKEWEKLKEEYDFIYVTDAGKTEIEAGSETVAILYPMFRDERSKTLKRCQLL